MLRVFLSAAQDIVERVWRCCAKTRVLRLRLVIPRATPRIGVRYKCSLEQETLECLDDSEGKAGWSSGRLRG